MSLYHIQSKISSFYDISLFIATIYICWISVGKLIKYVVHYDHFAHRGGKFILISIYDLMHSKFTTKFIFLMTEETHTHKRKTITVILSLWDNAITTL